MIESVLVPQSGWEVWAGTCQVAKPDEALSIMTSKYCTLFESLSSETEPYTTVKSVPDYQLKC